MQIESVQYHKVFNLGDYSNEKIGVDIKIGPGEDPIEAFAEAKRIVEKSHRFFQDMPVYDRAKKIVSDPDSYTGREVKQSEQVIKAFEENYPDYIAKFVPANRTLKEGERYDEPTHSYEQDDNSPF